MKFMQVMKMIICVLQNLSLSRFMLVSNIFWLKISHLKGNLIYIVISLTSYEQTGICSFVNSKFYECIIYLCVKSLYRFLMHVESFIYI